MSAFIFPRDNVETIHFLIDVITCGLLCVTFSVTSCNLSSEVASPAVLLKAIVWSTPAPLLGYLKQAHLVALHPEGQPPVQNLFLCECAGTAVSLLNWAVSSLNHSGQPSGAVPSACRGGLQLEGIDA